MKNFNLDQWWNNNKCWYECKKHHIWKKDEKDYLQKPAKCSYEIGKYFASIKDDSAITSDEIIEETETVLTNFNEKKSVCKTQKFYILLAFLLITVPLLIAACIYCYLIKYQTIQK